MNGHVGIPVTIHLDRATFTALEHAAIRRDTTIRDLIGAHLRRSLWGEQVPTTHLRARGRMRGVSAATVDQWEQAARMGVTNSAIAERWQVSDSLVSVRLRERGIHRQRPRTENPQHPTSTNNTQKEHHHG